MGMSSLHGYVISLFHLLLALASSPSLLLSSLFLPHNRLLAICCCTTKEAIATTLMNPLADMLMSLAGKEREGRVEERERKSEEVE